MCTMSCLTLFTSPTRLHVFLQHADSIMPDSGNPGRLPGEVHRSNLQSQTRRNVQSVQQTHCSSCSPRRTKRNVVHDPCTRRNHGLQHVWTDRWIVHTRNLAVFNTVRRRAHSGSVQVNTPSCSSRDGLPLGAYCWIVEGSGFSINGSVQWCPEHASRA